MGSSQLRCSKLGGLGGEQTLRCARLPLVGRLVQRTVATRQSLGSESGNPDGTVGQQHGRKVTAEAFRLLQRANGGTAQIDDRVLATGESAQEQLRAVFALNDLGQSADGRRATRFESLEEGPLCSDAGASVRVVQRCQRLNQVWAILAALNGKGPLPRSREHLQAVSYTHLT